MGIWKPALSLKTTNMKITIWVDEGETQGFTLRATALSFERAHEELAALERKAAKLSEEKRKIPESGMIPRDVSEIEEIDDVFL